MSSAESGFPSGGMRLFAGGSNPAKQFAFIGLARENYGPVITTFKCRLFCIQPEAFFCTAAP